MSIRKQALEEVLSELGELAKTLASEGRLGPSASICRAGNLITCLLEELSIKEATLARVINKDPIQGEH